MPHNLPSLSTTGSLRIPCSRILAKASIGPKPPIGTHRYFFKVFAVDTVLSFNEPPELKDVFNAIDGRVVQMAETMGTYKLQF